MATFSLNALKERIQTILETANTTTASNDLSSGMDSRIVRISKMNPDKVFAQATKHPSLHIYPENVTMESQGIAKTQATAKRRTEFNINIAGIYQSFALEDIEEDKAQKNLEIMMSNLESVLRDSPTLTDYTGVLYQIPTGIQYGIGGLDEDCYFRIGVLSLKVVTLY